MQVSTKLLVAFSSALAFVTVRRGLQAGITNRSWCYPDALGQRLHGRLWRKLWLPQGDDLGCHQASSEKCWAGVYVDPATAETLHLERGGRAFLSPGTAAADSSNGCLRWRANDGLLDVLDCHERPLTWSGFGGNLRRDPMQPGNLNGFGVAVNKDRDAVLGEQSPRLSWQPGAPLGRGHIVRDPLGFLFPGCMYLISFKSRLLSRAMGHEFHVVVHSDGTITDVESGGQIATWYFPRMKTPSSVGDESWATGDTVVLLVEAGYYESPGISTTGVTDGEADYQFVLATSDGGRAWLPVPRHQAELKSVPEVLSGSSSVESSCVTLSLVVPTAVSVFPMTSAMSPVVEYLNGGGAGGGNIDNHNMTYAGENGLQALVEVFEGQPLRLGRSGVDKPHNLKTLIVISRAVPRPTENKGDLACVINGARTRAVWLSWSMVLCSSTNVKLEQVAIYIEYQRRRFSKNFSFLHAPPPRHTRLAWPATEYFDLLQSRLVRQSARAAHPYVPGVRGVPSLEGRGRPETTVAVCTMFKNEAPYLEEWLQYHRLLGVSKVYMYDNDSSDKSRDLLRKHELSEFVHVRDWHHRGAQTEALNDCLCRFRHAARWMAFIDIDEYIDPAPGLPIQIIGSFSHYVIRSHSDADGFDFDTMAARRRCLQDLLLGTATHRNTHCMPWVNYCSQGQLYKPPGGTLDNFLEYEDMGQRRIHMQKPLFVALEALTLRRIGPHFLLYATEDIDAQYHRNLNCPGEWLDPSTLHIRHYRSRSLEEYVQRRAGADSAYRAKKYTKEKLAVEWKETNAKCGGGGSKVR